MRENCTSGLMRGSNGNGDSRPLLSTLLAVLIFYTYTYGTSGIHLLCLSHKFSIVFSAFFVNFVV